MATPLKILIIDIETAPMLSMHWRMYRENIGPNQVMSYPFVLTWSAKWRGEKKVYSDRLTGKEARNQDDQRLVFNLAELIREADIVVAHNINKFDLPKINGRLAQMKMEPVGPVRTIDTLTLARKDLGLASNSLDNLLRYFGHDPKIKTDFDLWRRCYLGEVKALKEMERYNRYDVVGLEMVFEDMLPYVRNVGRLVDADWDGEDACPSCGSHDLQKRGFYRTNVSNFQRIYCKSCQKYSSYRTSERKRLRARPR